MPGAERRATAYRPLLVALVLGLLLVGTGAGVETAVASIRSRVLVSTSPDRSGAQRLDGAVLKGSVHVFLRSPRLNRVEFYLDDPTRGRPPVRVDMTAPFDLAGTAAGRRARPYNSRTLSDGLHTLTTVQRSGRRSSTRSVTFRVANAAPASAGSWPKAPPARVCDNVALLKGPASPPAGAVTVPAGDNSRADLGQPGKTYWFAPGVHTLGSDEYSQIIPGDGSTYIGGPGAIIDGKAKNRYAFTQHARDVTIKYLTIRNFVAPMNEGTVNHDSGEGWTMTNNTVVGNGGAGIFLGTQNVARFNCLKGNSQYGFQAYGNQGGESGIVLDRNEIVGNNTGSWETKQPGCGCTGGGKFWDVRNVKVTNNYVHDNLSVALWADTNANNFLFEGNWIEDNEGQAIFWEISYNAAIRNNVIRHNLTVTGAGRGGFGPATTSRMRRSTSPSPAVTRGCRTAW